MELAGFVFRPQDLLCDLLKLEPRTKLYIAQLQLTPCHKWGPPHTLSGVDHQAVYKGSSLREKVVESEVSVHESVTLESEVRASMRRWSMKKPFCVAPSQPVKNSSTSSDSLRRITWLEEDSGERYFDEDI